MLQAVCCSMSMWTWLLCALQVAAISAVPLAMAANSRWWHHAVAVAAQRQAQVELGSRPTTGVQALLLCCLQGFPAYHVFAALPSSGSSKPAAALVNQRYDQVGSCGSFK